MKNLIMAVALTTALMGASVAVAEDASQSLSFEDAEKMEQMSEQDKQQKGAGALKWVKEGWNMYQKSKYVKPTTEIISGGSSVYDVTKTIYDNRSRIIGSKPLIDLRPEMHPNVGTTMPPMQIQIPVRR